MSTNGVNGNNYVYTVARGDYLIRIARENNTTLDALLKLNPQIKNPNLILIGQKLFVPDNKPFTPREDYDPTKMNLGEVKVNGNIIEDKFNSNYFANNNLDKLGNAGDKVTVSIKPGKEINKNDTNAYSLYNKILSKHLNNNSRIVTDSDGKRRPENQKEAFESTDLYKALISNEVNGDNFDESGNLIPRGDSGNSIQLPTIGKDAEGKTYFVIHGKDNLLYFDSTGTSVEFADNKISSKTKTEKTKEPQIDTTKEKLQSAPQEEEFAIPTKYSDKQLNLGKIYINGKPVDIKPDANFFRNQTKNNIPPETINDGITSSRLDVQLKAGENLNPKYRDDFADEILSSHLGNNCDKIAIFQEKNKPEALELLRKTDLYKALVSKEVNGDNFDENGKLKIGKSGSNTVQLPALEVDENGTKYYVLHTADKVLYFNEKGISMH